MANLAGYDIASYGNMLNHYTRHAGDPDQAKYAYRNGGIDKRRTHLNYAIYEKCVSSRGFEQKEHRKLSSLSIGSAHAF